MENSMHMQVESVHYENGELIVRYPDNLVVKLLKCKLLFPVFEENKQDDKIIDGFRFTGTYSSMEKLTKSTTISRTENLELNNENEFLAFLKNKMRGFEIAIDATDKMAKLLETIPEATDKYGKERDQFIERKSDLATTLVRFNKWLEKER